MLSAEGRLKAGIIEEDPTKSFDVIAHLPYNMIVKQLGLRHAKSLQILYPAGGTHVVALEVGVMLLKMLPNLEKVTFIFTEINNPRLPEFPEAYFEAYMSVLEPDMRIVGKNTVKFDKKGTKRETIYQLTVRGRAMELVYAIDLSDTKAGDHGYFKKKYVADSDIIMFHDTFECGCRDIHLRGAISTVAVWAAKSGRQKAIISENLLKAFSRKGRFPRTGTKDSESLPGIAIFVNGNYGCPLHQDYGGAMVFFPDNQRFLNLSPAAWRRFSVSLGER